MNRTVDLTSPPAIDAPRGAHREQLHQAAVELMKRHESTLKRTARRYSICSDDADDAYQRALEILITKAPTTDLRQLIRWMQVVTKHEALAVRRIRERVLSDPAPRGADEGERQDWVQLIPSDRDGPEALVERQEVVDRSREALTTLKPQELRALTLLAGGYSYSEITEMTGWTYTKVNRCLAEGRSRFRSFLTQSEQGQRCSELADLLSRFCDGETAESESDQVRLHLRACSHCRATLRTYRATPAAAAALAPLLPFTPTITERAHDLLASVHARLPGRTGASDSALSQVAATGGSAGGGVVLVTKAVAICAGVAGTTAACVAVGVLPSPVIGSDRPVEKPSSAIERLAEEVPATPIIDPLPEDPTPAPAPDPEPSPESTTTTSTPEEAPVESVPEPTPVEQEFTPEAAGSSVPAQTYSAPPPVGGGGSSPGGGGGSSGSAVAAEFGP